MKGNAIQEEDFIYKEKDARIPLHSIRRRACLCAAEVLTILVWGAWRDLTDKAKVYFHVQTYHRQEFPDLGAYSKFVEATNG